MRYLLVLVCLATPAAAQFNRNINTNVAAQHLRLHTPDARARDCWSFFSSPHCDIIELYAVTRQGLSVRQFDRNQGRWADWEHLGNPLNIFPQDPGDFPSREGWDRALTVLPADDGSDQTVAFNSLFESARSSTMGVHLVDAPNRSMAFDHDVGFTNLGAQHFSARTGLRDFNRVLRVFGNRLNGGETTNGNGTGIQYGLVEAEYSGGHIAWHWHGSPTPGHVVVGPQGAVEFAPQAVTDDGEYDPRSVKFVAASTGPGQRMPRGGISYPAVSLRQTFNGGPWQWIDLGAPEGWRIYGAPLVVSRLSDAPLRSGQAIVSVFAVGHHPQRDEFSLFERRRVGWSGWSAWADLGRPGDIGPRTAFRMTAGLVWYHGQDHNPADRHLNLFGYSEPEEGETARLLHYWGRGGFYRWGQSDLSPDGTQLRLSTATVLDHANDDRISVFVRTFDGSVWERYYQINNGTSPGWRWLDLSWEPRYRIYRR